MLLQESLWIKSILNKFLTTDNTNVLNIGSSSKNFRRNVQPLIYENVFSPLYQKNIQVTHTDLQDAEGVDLVGDLLDEEFATRLKQRQYNLVICSNLLEHVVNPQQICEMIESILPKGGLAIITVPYVFPYHKDPIDTLYRPSVTDILKMFTKVDLLEREITVEDDNYFDILKKNPRYFMVMTARLLMPFYKFKDWKNTTKYYRYFFKKFKTTCILIRKI